MNVRGEMDVEGRKVEGESSRSSVIIYCLLLVLLKENGMWHSRWDAGWRGDGASPQGLVGGFITPRAAPNLLFSQQEFKRKKGLNSL